MGDEVTAHQGTPGPSFCSQLPLWLRVAQGSDVLRGAPGPGAHTARSIGRGTVRWSDGPRAAKMRLKA
jgi:hypothetical protein